MLHAPMKCEVITKVCNYNIKCADGNTTLENASHLLMCECWSKDPDGRPTFSDLVSTISERLEGLAGYMDFSPTWSSGDKTKVSRYDHLLPSQTKENHKGYDHLNPTVVVTDEESLHVTPDKSSTGISESLEGLAGYMDFSPTWSSGDKTIHCIYCNLRP